MDPRLAFWTGAFVNMVLVVLVAARGVSLARRGRIDAHRRWMLTAAALVLAFVLSYALKLVLLGREDLATWGPRAVLTLRIHELCVAAMLLGGTLAGVCAWRMRSWVSAPGAGRPGSIVRPNAASQLAWHRRGGWTAVMGAVLGVLTAAAVLYGMYARAGLA